MEAIIFCGIQGSGKSTFFRDKFFDTHVRINMDMLRARHREEVLLNACIAGKARFVVDNTNPTISERARYLVPAKAAGFYLACYYFSAKLADAIERNAGRSAPAQVPAAGLLGTYKRLRIPSRNEGFDALFYVRCRGGGGFDVEPWRDDLDMTASEGGDNEVR